MIWCDIDMIRLSVEISKNLGSITPRCEKEYKWNYQSAMKRKSYFDRSKIRRHQVVRWLLLYQRRKLHRRLHYHVDYQRRDSACTLILCALWSERPEQKVRSQGNSFEKFLSCLEKHSSQAKINLEFREHRNRVALDGFWFFKHVSRQSQFHILQQHHGGDRMRLFT